MPERTFALRMARRASCRRSTSPSSWLVIGFYAASRRGIHAGISLASRRASYFSLRGQREVTKRKATPIQRSPGILPSDSAQRLRGWLTVHPWTGSQLARIPASHPRIESGTGSTGLFSATAPLHRGPNYCASCAAKTKQIPALANFRVSRRTCSGRGSFSSFSRVAGEGAAGGWGALIGRAHV